MATLVYKRTHISDPDKDGVFGCYDCMGKVRDLAFDSVIGIGGIGAEPQLHRIDGKITWIGVGAHKRKVVNRDWRGPLVTFDHFVLFNAAGDELDLECPALAKRFFAKHAPRYVLNNFTDEEQAEIDMLLASAMREPPSKAVARVQLHPKCPPKLRRKCPPKQY